MWCTILDRFCNQCYICSLARSLRFKFSPPRLTSFPHPHTPRSALPSALVKLDLCNNNIGPKGANAIAKLRALKHDPSTVLGGTMGSALRPTASSGGLRCLLLRGGGLGAEGSKLLAAGLKLSCCLQHLDISRNLISSDGKIAIGEWCSEYTRNIHRVYNEYTRNIHGVYS